MPPGTTLPPPSLPGGGAPSDPPFVDRRKAIQAFFSIWCPNRLGTSLTKFSSGPDSFALSQSWGWKSSSLRSAEYIGAAAAAANGADSPVVGGGAEEGAVFSALRVSIVMGRSEASPAKTALEWS